MLYLVYEQTDGQDLLYSVSEPKKNAKGCYECKKTSGTIATSGLKTIPEMSNFIIPFTNRGALYGKAHTVDTKNKISLSNNRVNQISTTKYKFYVSNIYTYSFICQTVGVNFPFNTSNGKVQFRGYNAVLITNNIKKFINENIDTSDNIKYLKEKLNNSYSNDKNKIGKVMNDLYYSYHKKGDWTATVKIVYTDPSPRISDINNTKISSIVPAGGTFTKTYIINNSSTSIGSIDIFKLSNNATLDSFEVNVELNFKDVLLAEAGTWEVGAVKDASNKNNYCFYSRTRFGPIKGDQMEFSYPLEYFKVDLPCYTDKNADKAKNHVCVDGAQPGTYNAGTSVSPSSGLSYIVDGDINRVTNSPVNNLKYGTSGEYKDGVATVPYVMIELRSPSNPNSKDFYNLSIPAESFVSLIHERNLQDQYNTFKLQLFDKNAMQVEAKLLLGFRSITFYYTDFVSTSKRFRGEILNYQTVITGKGLMLTLEGYTSNLDLYTYQDSIPWSILFGVKDYSFFYWTNNENEYHGPVRINVENGNVDWLNTEESYWKGLTYTASNGIMIPSSALKHDNKKIYDWFINTKDKSASDNNKCEFQLMTKNESTGKEEWVTFDEFYEKSDLDMRNKYRPYPQEFSLTAYYPDIEDGLAIYNTKKDAFEMRPSNVVRMICLIMKWKFKDEYIVKTRTVTQIPDQVSESYLEYIEKKLVPISESTNGNTQFVFWFDDEGYAHYEPMIGTNKIKKTLYFNSGEKKDSYPLIGFTASTNGAVLMQADASNVISSINVYTGEEYDLSKVDKSDNPILTSQMHQTEEWYVTNTKINANSKLNLINYQNVSIVPSEDELRKELVYRYGLVAKYSYNANLEVYGCADISPGDTIGVYIYINDGVRTSDPVSEYREIITKPGEEYKRYRGNTTMHHSSGTYIVQKITDTISGGRYISSMNVLKIDSSLLENINSSYGEYETYKQEQYMLTEEEFQKRLNEDPESLGLESVDPNSNMMNKILKWNKQ